MPAGPCRIQCGEAEQTPSHVALEVSATNVHLVLQRFDVLNMD